MPANRLAHGVRQGLRRSSASPLQFNGSDTTEWAASLPYIAVIITITVCCLVIQAYAPEGWLYGAAWLMVAPAIGLIFSALPTMALVRRYRAVARRADEQTDLVSLLLKDYAADRCDWMWSSDVEGKLFGVSEKFATQAASSISSLEGKPFLQLLRERFADDEMAYSEISLAMRQCRPFHDVEFKVRREGGEVWWRLAGKPVYRETRFNGYIGTMSDITTEVRAKETLSFLAYNDGLTGLSNRSHFTKRLNECVARLERYGSPFAVLYLDLDKFKAVNDSRGHQMGDQLLVQVGRRLGGLVRDTDVVARLGGDEFAIIMPDGADAEALASLAKRLIAVIEQPFTIEGEELIIGLSVGIALAPTNGTRPDQLLRNADLALYRAKEEGGNRFCFFDSRMDSEMRERRILELELAEALVNDEFALHYQPVIAPNDGTVSGFEALIRWHHPIRGLVPPSEFIPIAEGSSLIAAIGQWTVGEACRMLARLPEHLTVAVNLSARHFRTADITKLVSEATREAGVDPRRLELEITESLLIENAEEMALKLDELKRAGFRIAMDDFGTGFSSLSYLQKYPFDKIKIDRSFVQSSSEDRAAREILRAIVGLAGTLNMAVTAEGVETADQATYLRSIGCDLLQGYFFARPMPEADVADFLERPPVLH